MVIGILDSHLSPGECKSTFQLLCLFCSGNSDTSTAELKAKGGLVLLKPGPHFTSNHELISDSSPQLNQCAPQ